MIAFEVKSSGSEPYMIYCEVDGDRTILTCDCKAGAFGSFCKHKGAVILGDDSFLFDEAEREQFNAAVEACKQAGIPAIYEAYKKELAAIDDEEKPIREQFKKRRAAVRARFSRILVEGGS